MDQATDIRLTYALYLPPIKALRLRTNFLNCGSGGGELVGLNKSTGLGPEDEAVEARWRKPATATDFVMVKRRCWGNECVVDCAGGVCAEAEGGGDGSAGLDFVAWSRCRSDNDEDIFPSQIHEWILIKVTLRKVLV